MLKQIKDCSYNQLYSYMITNLRAITKEEESFPKALLMFLNNPNNNYLTNTERAKILRQIISELKEENAEMYIDID